jgi:hypothetical protein
MGEFFRNGDGHLGLFEMLVFQGIRSKDVVEDLGLYRVHAILIFWSLQKEES